MKFIKDGNVIEDFHENNYSAYIRAGFVKMEEEPIVESIESDEIGTAVEDMKRPELLAKCKELELTGYSNLKNVEIIEMINKAEQ